MRAWRFSETEKAYAKYCLKSNTRLIVITMIILYLMMNQNLFTGAAVNAAVSVFVRGTFVSYYGNGIDITSLYLLAFAVGTLAFLLTLYQFRFLMKKTSCDLYMSLPIERNRLFYVQYMMGAGALVSMSSLVYFLLGVLNQNQLLNLGLFAGFCFIQVAGLLLYTFFSWICIQCSTLFDTIVVMVLYTIIPFILMLTLRAFYSLLMNSILVSELWGVSGDITDVLWVFNNFISLPWLMRSGLYLLECFFNGGYLYYGISTTMVWGYIAASVSWLLVGIYLYTSARSMFHQRKSEVSEQRTIGFLTYPVLLPLFVTSLLLLCGVSFGSIIWVILIFFVYVGSYFLVKRKICFHRKMLYQFISIAIGIGAMQWMLIETNIFGFVQEIPKKEDITSITVYVTTAQSTQYSPDEGQTIYNSGAYTTTTMSSEEIMDQTIVNEVLEEHEKLLPLAKKYDYKDSYGVRIHYHLKGDLNIVVRSYGFSGENTKYAKQLMERWQKEKLIKPEEYHVNPEDTMQIEENSEVEEDV